MEKGKFKKLLKTAIKFVLTGVALYIVFRKIDLDETKKILSEVNYLYLIPATFLFAVSKVASSYRLNQYFKAVSLQLTEQYNLKLYWVGMFYNLFLPGGIGGDGYKVYLLNKNYKTPVKQLISATLIDRISGLMALLFLLLLLVILILPLPFMAGLEWLVYVGIAAGYPVYYLFNKLLFKSFLDKIVVTSLYSLAVQGLQIVCAYFILLAIGVYEQHLAYQVLFLTSSIVAVLPFTIGGVGARELTFILGHEYLEIDQNAAVAFSLIFFLITAIVSLFGAFIGTKSKVEN